jgi:hypothetical protein
MNNDNDNDNSNNGRNGSNNSDDTRLKVSHSDFLRKDSAGLVRLLKIIEAAGKDGISTIKLCGQAFKTRNYGMRVINRAYDEGYIKRFGKNKRGHNKVNYLSDRGKALLLSCSNTKKKSTNNNS